MDDIQREGVEPGSEPSGGGSGSEVSEQDISGRQSKVLDDEEHSDVTSSESRPENVEKRSGVSGRRKRVKEDKKEKTAAVSESEEVFVRSMIEARVRLISPTTGNEYFFPRSGSEVKVALEDVNWLLNKRQTSGPCCGPLLSNLAFELV